MHDYHKAVKVTEDAIKEAKSKGKDKVTTIHMVIGEDSGYSKEAIQMHFEDVSQGTICEGAKIVFRDTKAMLKCPKCGEMFSKKPFEYNCPKCDAEGEPTEIGREVDVESIDFE